MSLACPPKILIENYMIEIAKSYKVPFEPDPVIMMGEPPATSNLIDLGMDSFAVNGGSANASVGASYPSNTNQSHYDNASSMTAADRKRMEANGEQPPQNNTNRRPPSPPNGGGGGGGGAFAYPPMGGMEGGASAGVGSKCEYNFPGSVPVLPQNGQFQQPPKPPRVGQTSPDSGQHLPPALPNRPPNSNHGSPETDDGQKGMHGMHRSPFNPTMSMFDDDDQLPSLPAYDAVVNSPGQFPSTRPQFSNNQQPPATTISQQPSGPVPAPRGASNAPPRLPDVPNLPEMPGLPSVPANSVGVGSVGGDDVNFDDLTRRFEELKRRK